MSEPKIMSVVTIPLITEKWQKDVLFKRFEMCRKIYNVMLGYEQKQLRLMKNDKDYSSSKKIIFDIYKLKDEKEKKAAKKSDVFKWATQMQKDKMREYGFSEFQFRAEALKRASYYKENIPTISASGSIGAVMWSAFEKLFFNNGKAVHYKKFDSWQSIMSDGKSGIRLVGDEGKTLRHGIAGQMYLLFGVRPYKVLKMPLKVDKKDMYKLEMLDRDIKVMRITRKLVKGDYKYYVQFTVVGAPAISYNADGSEKHSVGNSKMGIYIDTTSLTIALADKIIVKDISFGNKEMAEKIANLQRYMETSRRISNAENYNEDGTIKKGIWKDGQRHRLSWTFSNGYKKAKSQLANMERVQAEQRKLRNNILANEIIALGTDIEINDYPFQAAAIRKKEDEFTDRGTPKSKAKAGKKIGENAPAAIVLTIDTKLKGMGYPGVVKKKLSDIDYKKDGYRKFYANELLRELN